MSHDLRFRLCPPFFNHHGMRYDTPATNEPEHYRRDCAWFKANIGRKLMLRTAGFKEFDFGLDTTGEWLRVPTLHVLVTQHAIGIHHLIPLYRGKAFFGEVSTDLEVSMIVAEMYARRGIDRAEFIAYELDCHKREVIN